MPLCNPRKGLNLEVGSIHPFYYITDTISGLFSNQNIVFLDHKKHIIPTKTNVRHLKIVILFLITYRTCV